MTESGTESEQSTNQPDRRKFLTAASHTAMAGGLVAGYGTFFAFAGRFLYPAREPDKAWMFAAEVAQIPVGTSRGFRLPSGASVVIARQGESPTVESFLALSSTCPHLGCQVHWEQVNNRFFCPCHNGVFSPDGTGIGGPPGDAGQSLPSYPLKVEDGLLFIEVDQEEIALGPGRVIEPFAGPSGPGHDPCLRPTATPCGCTERS
jgi:Rieske Fe-S protein